jgi:protein O-mannosyl-transferase
MSSNQSNFFSRPLPALLGILLAGVIVYANSFQVPFILDDEVAIVRNDNIRHLGSYFASSGWYAFSPPRFFSYLTFALNYRFGGLDVTGYHAINLIIHLTAALLVYALVRLSFRTPHLCSSRLAPRAGLVALLAALFFAVHPVQTQAVTYIVQRMASMATMFYLLAVVLYVQARLKTELQVSSLESQGGAYGKKPLLPVILLLAGSVLAAVLAMKTKEIAFTLPLAILLYEGFFFQGDWKRRLLYLLPVLATLPIVPLSVLAGGESTGDSFSDLGEQARAQTSISRLDYLFTQFRVIGTYLRLLVLPINQNLDYDYPVYTTFFTPPVFLSFLLVAAILALAIYLFRNSRQSVDSGQAAVDSEQAGVGIRQLIQHPFVPDLGPSALGLKNDPGLRLISFGILWFFLALAVESSLVPIADVIFEHRLYLPSFGAAAAFATLFFFAGERFSRPIGAKLSVVIAGVMVSSLALATFQRNHVWGDDIRLWQDVIAKSPGKIRAYNNLGVALTDAGRLGEAIEVLSLAIQVETFHPHAYNNLGRAYILAGQNSAALPMLNMAIRLDPNFIDAHINKAAVLNVEGKFREAVNLLERNYSFLEGRAEVHFQLGVAYASLGNREAARRELAIVSRLDAGLASHLAGLLR